MKSGCGRLALAVVCLLTARAAWAAAPAGSYALDVGGDNEIWFPSGDDTHCDDDGMGDTICLLTSASTDATGAVSGTGELQLNFPGLLDANMPGTFAGRLSGSPRNPVAKIAASMSGPGTLLIDPNDPNSSIPVVMTGTAKLTCRNPLPHGPEFQCRATLKLCLEALGRRSCHGARVSTVLGAAGGPWTSALELLTDPKGLVSGSASAMLAGGASESFGVTGKYNAKTDLSSLRLRPPNPKLSRDSLSLSRLRVDGVGGVQGAVISFKVAGQKGRALIPPPP